MNESKQGRSEASKFWSKNLDPQNLEREANNKSRISLDDEIAFAATPDVLSALDWLTLRKSPTLTLTPTPTRALARARALTPSPLLPQASPPISPFAFRLSPFFLLDLGAGLGAISFVFARAGHRVLAVDTSLDRLRELMRRAREAGCADKIMPVVAAAEALPFAADSVPALFTKSVLIHTDLPAATAEIRRVLAHDGRAALIEPQPGNPFAWLYRRTLAPKEWQSITRYFDAETHRFCIEAIGHGETQLFYLFSFLAFAFQFAWPDRKLFFASLKVLHAFDDLIFRALPFTRRYAWFGLNKISRETVDRG